MKLGNCGDSRGYVIKLPSAVGRYSGGGSVVWEGKLVDEGVSVIVVVDFGADEASRSGEA
jgi:hypothetical protein